MNGSCKVMDMRRIFGALLVALLFGCGSELTTPSEALTIKSEALPDAFIGESYSAIIRAVGGLTPYTFRLSRGDLPPGLSLQGGTISGVPSTEGSYSFTVTVSDGNLSETFMDYSLNVTTPPPASISFNVPDTDIQRTVVLRAELKDARSLQAFRTLASWDAQLFEYVPGSLRALNDSFALIWNDEVEGQLQVDVGILGATLSGDRRAFEFELRPIETTTLELSSQTEFIGSDNSHAFLDLTEGIPSDFFDDFDEEFEDDPGDPSLDPENPDDPNDADNQGDA